ncbi:MaoC family dehydratase N-terminal domain-containing protein [Nocardia salmonicida]|uniref:FAS1-like dehydratase domain-containing protein n=1 Tax=Nocardia salmonicida TaxID=53431 RepID=UPI00366DED74
MPKLEYQNELTDEMISEAESLVGKPLRIEQWNHEATMDTIRHYAWGVGDNNPLYCDEGYAEASVHGGIIAPPTFLYSIFSAAMGLGLVGLQPVYGGTKWEFLETIRRGDRIKCEAKVGPIKVMTGRTAKRFVMQTCLVDYIRSDGTLVGRSEGRTFRIPRSQADGGLSYERREPRQWSVAELDDIMCHAVAEPVRGIEARYWDDVGIGEHLPKLVKGPIDLQTMTGYYAGLIGAPSMKSVEMKWLYRWRGLHDPDKLPNNYDPTFYSEITNPGLGHIDPDTASEVGMPGAYGNGAQKSAWMAHTVLNWIGDEGFMTELETRLRRPDVFGDVVWCSAAVTGKPSPGIVELSLSAANQDGEVTATGRAAVRLPVRGA